MAVDVFFNPNVPSYVPDDLVHDYNVYDYEGRDPFEVMHKLHIDDVPEIFWTRHNGGHWIASRSAAITEVAMDTVNFSSERQQVPDHQNVDEPFFLPLVLDPPVHSQYRQLVAPFFMPNQISKLQQSLRKSADNLISDILAKGECEFVADFAAQMPVLMFLDLLDLPHADRLELLEIASAVIKPDEGEHRSNPLDRLFDYVRPIIEQRRAMPGDDVISQLVQKRIDGSLVDFEKLVRLTATLLLGGLDTVTASLTFLAAHLAHDPTLRLRLLKNPELISATVEESLRRFPPASPGRIVRERCVLRGVQFMPGDHLVWATGMFNFDDKIHDDPMAFSIDRKRAPHATFGVGVHFCIGAFLARLEMKIFLERWINSIPQFRIKSDALLRHRVGITIALEDLPLVIN